MMVMNGETKAFAIVGIVIVILLAVVFGGDFSCTGSNWVSQGREAYQGYFKDNLRDPESLVVYDESYTEYEGDSVVWHVEYGARNGFGGMNRTRMKFVTIGSTVISADEEKGY